MSQDRAENMSPPASAMMISVTDHGAQEADLRDGWSQVLRLAFDDLDLVAFPEDGTLSYEGLTPMTEDQAGRLVDFVLENMSRSPRIVVHCKYGVSRSAGIAKAIAEALGVRFPSTYNEYNVFVYTEVLKQFGAKM